MCCPRDCVSRHNRGTAGGPLKPIRDDSALRALSTLRGLRGAPTVPPLCRETSVSRTAHVGTVRKNGLIGSPWCREVSASRTIQFGKNFGHFLNLKFKLNFTSAANFTRRIKLKLLQILHNFCTFCELETIGILIIFALLLIEKHWVFDHFSTFVN